MMMLVLVTAFAVAGGAASSPYQINADALELYKQAHYREAEEGFRRALQAWADAGPDFAHDHAAAALNLGTVLRVEARYAEAEPILLEALRQFESLTGKNSVESARAAAALSALYQAWGRQADAAPLATR